ncbi:J domain-containing protein [Haloarcula montana]|uniref:J domain-containing protein n=1 Tax=Haloarcula montana TaxID=3111776 RepID=UPI002D794C85|nr:DnaJ domain-containing protein [Haloarcula sp. GH36]
MTETYYDVLGIAEDASVDEVETAYRERLKETHPDVSDDDDAQTATQRIVEARDVLVDEDERETYDRVGHTAYVEGESTATTPESDASAAARQAGYGEETDGSASESSTTQSHDSGSGGRGRTDRERRARERVSQDAGRSRRRRRTDNTGPTANASAAGATMGASASGSPSASGSSTDYAVRQDHNPVRKPEDLIPSGRELTVLGLSFAFYPVLLASAVFPPFPLWVNVLVGLCAVFVFGYLQSMPRIAVAVFGGWSLLAPLILLGLPFGIFSIVGIFTLCGTWLPFAFSVLTLSILR